MIPELNTCIDQLNAEAVEPAYFDAKNIEGEKMGDIIKDLDAKIEAFKQYENTSERYNDWQTKLYVPQTNFDNLDELRTQLTSRHLMWHSLEEWNNLTADWL